MHDDEPPTSASSVSNVECRLWCWSDDAGGGEAGRGWEAEGVRETGGAAEDAGAGEDGGEDGGEGHDAGVRLVVWIVLAIMENGGGQRLRGIDGRGWRGRVVYWGKDRRVRRVRSKETQ